MFDFIRKTQLWAAWDAGLDKKLGAHPHFHLKSIQDLIVFDQLKDARGLDIAEVGGGDSRLLKALARDNRCVNIDKFDGTAVGPAKEIKIPGVRNVRAFLGENSPDLRDASFDVVFSVSVVEHVPDDKLAAFFADMVRILRPGGRMIHAIDMYLEDEPTAYWNARYEAYRHNVLADAALEPIGDVYDGPLEFSCAFASNPDDTMYQWGRLAPQLAPLRLKAQSVSLICAARKR